MAVSTFPECVLDAVNVLCRRSHALPLIIIKDMHVPLFQGKWSSLNPFQPTTEGYNRYFHSLLFEISSAEPRPPKRLANTPMGVLYSALQGWQLVTAFQFGSLSSPRDEDKVLKWLAELLWKLADLKAECHDMKPVMLMAIVSAHPLHACPGLPDAKVLSGLPQIMVANPAEYKSSRIGIVFSPLSCSGMHTTEHLNAAAEVSAQGNTSSAGRLRQHSHILSSHVLQFRPGIPLDH